jgi:hypothetical protein
MGWHQPLPSATDAHISVDFGQSSHNSLGVHSFCEPSSWRLPLEGHAARWLSRQPAAPTPGCAYSANPPEERKARCSLPHMQAMASTMPHGHARPGVCSASGQGCRKWALRVGTKMVLRADEMRVSGHWHSRINSNSSAALPITFMSSEERNPMTDAAVGISLALFTGKETEAQRKWPA